MSTNETPANGISEDELNAFVDGELNAADRERVLEALARDEILQKRVAEIQQTTELLRHAYERPPVRRRAAFIARPRGRQVLAASVLLSAGGLAGWLLSQWTGTPWAAAPQAAAPRGVVIQVSRNDPAEWQMALINARNVRKAYGDQPMDVEIVAYGPGLKMFGKDSPLGAGLEEAAKSGVKLLVCGNTMRMTGTDRKDLSWLVQVVPSGIVEIMQKQGQGYAYVKP